MLLCMMMSVSAITYFFSQSTIDGVRELGFPDFFRIQLGVLKLLAVIVLIVPISLVPLQAKEWAYAGIALFLITAIVAHSAHGDPAWMTVMNLSILGLLLVSNYTMHKLLA